MLLPISGIPVRHLGSRDEAGVIEALHACDVHLTMTREDNLPNTVMEAMACGLPVILTDHCGTPVPDESWRVPVRNGAAIADRLLRYADDREQLGRDQERAAQFASAFSQTAFRARLGSVFQEFLSPGGASGTQ